MRIEPSDKDLDRFWDKVLISDDCWAWTSQTRCGYGLFRYKNKIWSAHRFAFALENDLDISLQVCHTCDNPPCIKPSHLFQGSAKVNSDDKMLKDRHVGTLNNEQVLAIRRAPQTNTMVRDLAKEYEVSAGHITYVLNGNKYGHLSGAIDIPPQFRGWSLTPEQVSEILQELKSPYWGQQTALAQKYGVKKATINHIARGRLQYPDTL